MARGSNNIIAAQPSGQNTVDGLLYGAKWNETEIQYSFPDHGDQYGYSNYYNENLSFSVVNQQQKDAAHFALDKDVGPAASAGFSVEGFTELDIGWKTGGFDTDYAAIRYGRTDTEGRTVDGEFREAYSTAWSQPPVIFSTVIERIGDVWTKSESSLNALAGQSGWYTILHETGHALGLKHGEVNTPFGALEQNYDRYEFTLMPGYNSPSDDYNQSYMMYDIAALQYLYGADYVTNSGDTIYSWDPDTGDTFVNGDAGIDVAADINKIFATIWDGGGTDTYDLSNYRNGVEVDLEPGRHSSFSAEQTVHLGGSFGPAQGNIYNALLHNDDTRSLIENATTGRGADMVSGNDVANHLITNGGNDTVLGLNGDDTLSGGGGNDRLEGGNGNDRLIGSWGNDTLHGNSGDDTIIGGSGEDRLVGFSGDDRLYGSLGDDSLWGSSGDDRLWGQNGDDGLFGQSGDDRLYGQDGDDLLEGGQGADYLLGGDGSDVFRFRSDHLVDWDDLSGGNNARLRQLDLIRDFTVGEDVISFDGFENVSGMSDLDAFTTSIGRTNYIVLEVQDTNERLLVDAGGASLNSFWSGNSAGSNFDFG